MAPRFLSDTYSVSPQIEAADVPALKEAGFALVICNRPDAEVPEPLQAEAIGAAVRAAGLAFEVLPLTHQTMTPENVAKQRALVEAAGGPVLAYCASGTRCSVIWSLSEVTRRPVDDVLNDAAQAGYDLSGLRGTLEMIAAQGS